MEQIQMEDKVLHICREIMVSHFYIKSMKYTKLKMCFQMKADFTASPNLTQFQQWLRNNASYSMIHTNLDSWKILLLHRSQIKSWQSILKSPENVKIRLFEHHGKPNVKKFIKQEHPIGQAGPTVISLAIKITNSSLEKEKEQDTASRYTRVTKCYVDSNLKWNINQHIDWNIKGTSNFDGFKPLPCPTSNTFEYDYTCSGVCRNATEKRERP